MNCNPGSLLDGVPTRLNNVNLIPQLFESDEEYPLPDNYELKRHDVLCGQMKSSGNERFRIIAEMRVQRYLKASCRREKVQIVTEMVDAVRQAGGNFVRLVPMKEVSSNGSSTIAGSKQQWFDIGNLKAREKASHSLRCCAAKYQNSMTSNVTRIPDVVSSSNVVPTDSYQTSKFRKHFQANTDDTMLPFYYPEPTQKKPRIVSNSFASLTENLPISSKEEDSMSHIQKSVPISLNDIILFQKRKSSEKRMFCNSICLEDDDETDADMCSRNIYRQLMEPVTTSSMHMKCGIDHAVTNELQPNDAFFSDMASSLRRRSLVESDFGLLIQEDNMLDLFEF